MLKKAKDIKAPKSYAVPAAFYEMVCNATRMGLFIYKLEDTRDDDSLRLIAVNPAGAAIAGMKASDMYGRSLKELSKGMMNPEQLKRYADVARNGRGFKIDEMFYERKGLPGVWYSFNVFPLTDACMGVIFEEITRSKQTEDRLSRLTLQLENIIRTVGSPIFVKDREHRWTILNDAFCKLMGHPRSLLLGKSDYDFFPREQAEVFWKKDEFVFKTRKQNTNEELFTDSSGKVHTIVTTKRVFSDTEANDILVGVINDVTELNKAHENLKVFRALMERSSDALYVVDPKDGAIRDVNHTACKRLGCTRKALLGMRVSDIQVKIQNAEEWTAFANRVRKEGSVLFIGEHRKRNGTTFPVEVNVTFVQAGGRGFLIAAARDITERRKMEDAERELKTLRGLVPMCARCKKIRNDKGYWEQVETYIENRSDAKFTHGICDKCVKDLYGKEDWYKALPKRMLPKK